MFTQNRWIWFVLFFAFVSCSPKRSVEEIVVSESSSECSDSATAQRYFVKWTSGATSIVTASDLKSFKSGFVTKNLDQIEYAVPDRELHFNVIEEQASSEGSDVEGDDALWGQDRINAAAAWNQNIKGQNVLVAVVDSQVDVTHSQIKGQIAYNENEIDGNGIDDDGNGYVDDYRGMSFVSEVQKSSDQSAHGTHVSGIIAANHKGTVHGIAPDAKIIPAAFIAPSGSGSLVDAISALNYAASRGARVINASWGGSACMTALQKTFQELDKKGVLVVVAAGNSGNDIEQRPEYPASFNMSNQITIAAATPSDVLSWWSNSSFKLVHLAAPGERIYSTTPGENYKYFDGTSMAAPFVSGAAALLFSDQPSATPQQVRQALMESVDLSPKFPLRVYSRGRLNVQKAIENLRQLMASKKP